MMQLQSDQINELAAALAKAQGEIKTAPKDSTNPHFKSGFASLGAIWHACLGALGGQGLSVTQMVCPLLDREYVVTQLMHASGQWLRSYTPIINSKKDAQGLGSAITYARRYGLAALLSVQTGEDDDAETAVLPPEPEYKPAAKVAAKAGADDFVILKVMLEGDNVDPSDLAEFISSRANAANKSRDDVIRSALKPSLYERFREAYVSFSSRESDLLAV